MLSAACASYMALSIRQDTFTDDVIGQLSIRLLSGMSMVCAIKKFERTLCNSKDYAWSVQFKRVGKLRPSQKTKRSLCDSKD